MSPVIRLLVFSFTAAVLAVTAVPSMVGADAPGTCPRAASRPMRRYAP